MKVLCKLDKLLSERDMSQHELSRLTGIRQPSINDMCRNLTRRIPLENIEKICEVLNCEIHDLLVLIKEDPDC